MAFPTDVLKLSELISDIVTGAILQTAAIGNRIKIWQTGSEGHIDIYTGDPHEQGPAEIHTTVLPGPGSSVVGTLQVRSPDFGLGEYSYIQFNSASSDWTEGSYLFMHGDMYARIDSPAIQFVGTVNISNGATINNGANVVNGLTLNSGTRLNGIDFGISIGNFCDPSGLITIFHNLGVNPRSIVCQITGTGTAYKLQNTAHDASSFTVRGVNSSTNAVAPSGTAINFNWIALS